MLSRVAESIYWMNRYVERAENITRVVHVNLNLELDLPPGDDALAVSQWQPLIWTTGDEKLFAKRYQNATRENVIFFLTFDPDNPNSILSCVTAARENARSIREVISSEMWFTLNRFYLKLRDPDSVGRAADDPHTFYTSVKTACAQFLGETLTTMSYDEGYHFGRMGRLLERADKTSRILDVKYYILLPRLEDVGMPLDTIQWAALLKSASAFEMYRKAFSSITPTNVSRFLLLNRDFPRAVLHCVTQAQESLRTITGNNQGGFSNPPEQKLGRLLADLTYAHIDEVMKDGLHEYVDSLQLQLNDLDNSISKVFFDISPQETPAAGTFTQ